MSEDSGPLSLSRWPVIQVKTMLRLAEVPFDNAAHATFYKARGRHHLVRYLLDLLKACGCVGWRSVEGDGKWSEIVDRRSKGTIPAAMADVEEASALWPTKTKREIFQILAATRITLGPKANWRPEPSESEETQTHLGVDPVTGNPYH
jgi:hypothetical protein